jgi:hypothetical protein
MARGATMGKGIGNSCPPGSSFCRAGGRPLAASSRKACDRNDMAEPALGPALAGSRCERASSSCKIVSTIFWLPSRRSLRRNNPPRAPSPEMPRALPRRAGTTCGGRSFCCRPSKTGTCPWSGRAIRPIEPAPFPTDEIGRRDRSRGARTRPVDRMRLVVATGLIKASPRAARTRPAAPGARGRIRRHGARIRPV